MSFERDMLEIERCLREAMKFIGKHKKRLNALASHKKAIANGNTVGRKKLRNDDEIIKLRKNGLSIREIAKAIGLSTGAVQRGLK